MSALPAVAPIVPTPAAPHTVGSSRVRPSLRALLWCFGVWSLLGALMVLAAYADYTRSGKTPNLLTMLRVNLPLVLPMVLFSFCLHRYLERHSDLLNDPRRLLRLSCVIVPLGWSSAVLFNSAYALVKAGKEGATFFSTLMDRAQFDNFADFFVVLAALVFQVGYSSWRRDQALRAAWQRAQTDNLSLRLTLLQGQLEPHFLFNALNSISALVRASDRATALTALSQVSELLRYALRASKAEWLSVQDEINFMRDYLDLQKLRYADGLSVSWDVDDEEWSRIACPPLLFQPLVENAIRHGLEARDGHGYVELRMGLVDDTVRLNLRNPLGQDPFSQRGLGVGLAATGERLRMLYGDVAQLRTERLDDCFVTELTLPRIELNEQMDRADR